MWTCSECFPNFKQMYFWHSVTVILTRFTLRARWLPSQSHCDSSVFCYLPSSNIRHLPAVRQTKPNQQDIEVNLGHEDTTIRSQNDSEYDSCQYRRWAQLYVNQITESERKKHFRVSKGRVRCDEKVSWIRNTSEQLLIITKSWGWTGFYWPWRTV